MSVGDGAFYYDENTARFYSKNDIAIENDIYLLGNIKPFYIGVYYGLVYIASSKITSNRFGVASAINLNFLKDKSLNLDIALSAGTHFGLVGFENTTFLDIQTKLDYRIDIEKYLNKKEVNRNEEKNENIITNIYSNDNASITNTNEESGYNQSTNQVIYEDAI